MPAGPTKGTLPGPRRHKGTQRPPAARERAGISREQEEGEQHHLGHLLMRKEYLIQRTLDPGVLLPRGPRTIDGLLIQPQSSYQLVSKLGGRRPRYTGVLALLRGHLGPHRALGLRTRVTKQSPWSFCANFRDNPDTFTYLKHL